MESKKKSKQTIQTLIKPIARNKTRPTKTTHQDFTELQKSIQIISQVGDYALKYPINHIKAILSLIKNDQG